MGIEADHLANAMNVMSSMGLEISVMGSITFPVIMGGKPKASSWVVEFLIFDSLSAYNGVPWRPSQEIFGLNYLLKCQEETQLQNE